MFTAKLCQEDRERLERIESQIAALESVLLGFKDRFDQLSEGVATCEDKLDDVLSRFDGGDRGSIQGEETKKPEPIAMMPGYKTWSVRKAERQRRTASPHFLEKVRQGGAITETDVKKA